MAQKTFSQEQFKFLFFRYTFNKIPLKLKNKKGSLCFFKTLALISLLRANMALSGTNFFFLDKFSFFYPVQMCTFLQFHE
jgi:hypothetical protein